MPKANIALTVWVIFATLYVGYNEYGRVKVMVAERAYNAGITNSINKLIDESAACQPIPVSSGERSVQLISIKCLQQGNEARAEDKE